jgi:hypothetical protein
MHVGLPPQHASPAGRADRRLACGLLVSVLLHGIVLLLQFGVPGMGMPGATPPLTVRIASADPSPPVPVVPDPAPAVKPPAPPVSGMRLVDPVPAPVPVPPAPVKAKPKPIVKRDKPRRARRISPPLPAPATLEESTKVIAQDATLNDFVVPIVRPEEAEQKTVDIMDAQVGDDDGDAQTAAALEAEAAKAGQLKAAEDALAARLAEEQARLAALEMARAAQEQETQRVAAAVQARQQEQQKADQLAAERLRSEQAQAELQKTEQLRVERQKLEQQRAEQERNEQLRAEQKKVEQQVEQQRIEQQRAGQLRAEQQRVEQQRAEQLRVELQKAEQQRAEQQRAEQQRAEQQRAEQQRAEQQRAEQQQAEQQRADRERAERQAAQAAARERDAAAQAGHAGAGGRNAGPGGAGASAQIARNMMGSDLANRARELVKGIDVLRGDPPASRLRDARRVAVGAGERDASLRMYAESWRQKIERNASVNFPRNWVDEARKDPLVSVAVRSDGSVEDVTIITSSGRADMDEAVRRIVRVNARYSAFPAVIAQKYDVIDIRRVWRFDEVLKLMEEVR